MLHYFVRTVSKRCAGIVRL